VSAPTRPAGARSIDELLADARSRLRRVGPLEAAARNVLEWRFDPAGDARLPLVEGYDLDVVVLCSEGYTSSLAADALRSLGLHRATDVVGGFRAWVAVGLPVV
jgi:rhodanese-related sulfurtransferase